MAREQRVLWAVLGLALLLRLAWGQTRPTSDAGLAQLPDQVEYLSLGRNLLASGALVFHDARFDQDVYAYRTPGYPAFVALCAGNVRIVRALQAVVDVSTALAAYLIARRWTGERGGIVAAALVALNPLLIYFSGLVLSETLYTALLAWGTYCVVSPRRGAWLGGAALLTVGVLVRPAGIGLAVLMPVLGVLGSATSERIAWRGLMRGAASVIILTGALALWGWRNHQRVGEWVWLTTNEGITRYDGFNPRADGSSNQGFVAEMPRLRDMDELQRNELLSQMAANYITANPARVGELAAKKVLRTWSPIPLSEQFGSAKYVIVGLGYTAPFFLLVLLALWRRNVSTWLKVVMVAPAVYFTLVHAFSVGSLRYRVPVEPELAVIAAALFKRTDAQSPPTT